MNGLFLLIGYSLFVIATLCRPLLAELNSSNSHIFSFKLRQLDFESSTVAFDDSSCYLDAGMEIFSLTWHKTNVRSFKYTDIRRVKYSQSTSSLQASVSDTLFIVDNI